MRTKLASGSASLVKSLAKQEDARQLEMLQREVAKAAIIPLENVLGEVGWG
jgi:hypothetical protein